MPGTAAPGSFDRAAFPSVTGHLCSALFARSYYNKTTRESKREPPRVGA